MVVSCIRVNPIGNSGGSLFGVAAVNDKCGVGTSNAQLSSLKVFFGW